MLPTSAGVEPATSWSPVGWRIQLSHRGRLYWGPLVEYFCANILKLGHWPRMRYHLIFFFLTLFLSPSWIFDLHNFSLFRSRSDPVAKEQVSVQSDLMFEKRCRKLIFKMAAVVAILDILPAHLAILCLISTQMLIIKFRFNWIIEETSKIWILNIHFSHIYMVRLSLLTMTNRNQLCDVLLFVCSKMADETNLSSKLSVADRTRQVWGRKLLWWCLSSDFPQCTFLLHFADSFCFLFTSSPSYEASPLCTILCNLFPWLCWYVEVFKGGFEGVLVSLLLTTMGAFFSL